MSEGFTRKSFLKRSAALGVAGGLVPVLSACGSGSGSVSSGGEKKLIVVTNGGSWEEAVRDEWAKPFTAESGIEIEFAGPPDYGKIAAMVENSSVTWDVVDIGADFAISGGADGLLEPIDWQKLAGVASDFVDLGQYASGSGAGLKAEFAVPQLFWSMVITNRTDKFKSAPESWADVWDTRKFPGKRAMGTFVLYGTLESALLADGVKREEMYPLDIDRALAKLDEIKADTLWYETGAQMSQWFADGSVVTGLGWDGRVSVLKDEGQPIDYLWNESILTVTSMGVPKGAPATAEAMEFFDFVLSPEPQANIVKRLKYGPVNSKAFDLLSGEEAASVSGNADQVPVALWQNYEWWAENQEEAQRRFDAWRLG